MSKNNRDGKLLTTEELAQRWSMDSGSIENWRNAGKGPIFIKVGIGGAAPVRYRLCDIETWEKKHEVKPGDKK
jgi:hypothetical protein